MSKIAEYAISHLEDQVRAARSLTEVLRCYLSEWKKDADHDVILTVLMQIEGVLDHMHNGIHHPQKLKRVA